MIRISYSDVHKTLKSVLDSLGFNEARADFAATLFTKSSQDGVYSHGVHRFPRFVAMIGNGAIQVNSEAERISTEGVFERWEGNRGPGNLNAWQCMGRAIELAQNNGLGLIALRNTNHWMRGGTYADQAAEAGMIGICWTNTNQNMPPWGGSKPAIGNNPICFGIPSSEGNVILDMALAQFSYGGLSAYAKREEALPFPGGHDAEGNLSTDAKAIGDSWRPLPIGYWKGSGLSIVLDMVAAILSGGLSTKDVESDPLKETELSQVFIAIDPYRYSPKEEIEMLIRDIKEHVRSNPPIDVHSAPRTPGEGLAKKRKENEELGIPIDDDVWEQILSMKS